MGRGMRSGPGIGEMRRTVMRQIVVVDVVKGHAAAVGTVLVLNDRCHE